MEKHMIDANEKFFMGIRDMLKENGEYGWPDTGHIYTRKGLVLECSQKAYNAVAEIVSEEFLVNNFKVV